MWPFSRKRSSLPHQEPLFFRDSTAALAFACDCLDCNIRDGITLPVIVDDVEDYLAKVKYPTASGIRECLAAFPSEVHYPSAYTSTLCLAQFALAQGTTPVALIVAEIEPEFDPKTGWRTKGRLL